MSTIARFSTLAVLAAGLGFTFGPADNAAIASVPAPGATSAALEAPSAKVVTVSGSRRGGFGRRGYFPNRRWPDTRITKPAWIDCAVEKDFAEGGSAPYSIVRFTNASSHTLPAGSVIQYTLWNGQSFTYKLYHPLAPGQKSTAIDIPVSGYSARMTCNAFLKRKIRYLPSSRLPGSIH